MGGCRCIFQNCTVSTKRCPGMHFFHFPVNDKKRFAEWIKMTRATQILELPTAQQKNRVVCARHFRDECFMNYKMDRLMAMAVPTISRLSDDYALDYHQLNENDEPMLVKMQKPALAHLIRPAHFQCPLGFTKEEKLEAMRYRARARTEDTGYLSEWLGPVVREASPRPPAVRRNVIGTAPKTNKQRDVVPYQLPDDTLDAGAQITSITELSDCYCEIELELDVEESTVATLNRSKLPELDDTQQPVVEILLEVTNEQQDFIKAKGKTCREEVNTIVEIGQQMDRYVNKRAAAQIQHNFPKKPKFLNEIELTGDAYPPLNAIIAVNSNYEEYDDVLEIAEDVKDTVLVETVSATCDEATTSEMQSLEAEHNQLRKEHEQLQLEHEQLMAKYNSLEAQEASRNSPVAQKTAASMTKAQLFNGIKRYLSSSMVALVRMEMFGSADRNWKPDEQRAATDLLRLGENVYKYLCDEWRFRLPTLRQAAHWLEDQADTADDDINDL